MSRKNEATRALAAKVGATRARARELDAEARRAAKQAHSLGEKLDLRARRLVEKAIEGATYNADKLAVWGKSVAFLQDPRFVDAYRVGMDSGHHIGRPKGSREDIHIEWRVHVLCWAGTHAAHLDGDFVECGVNTGIFSLAVCRYINFNALDRDFWLFDTFAGVPESDMIAAESPERPRTPEWRAAKNARRYSECSDLARDNFAPYPRAHLVRGIVPESLATVSIERVAYLSIDMNTAAPERAAIEHFWPKLVPGAVVILDDYGWLGRDAQRRTMNDFAASVGVEILDCPTGQGLVLKP